MAIYQTRGPSVEYYYWIKYKNSSENLLAKAEKFLCKPNLFRLFDAKNVAISDVILKSNDAVGES